MTPGCQLRHVEECCLTDPSWVSIAVLSAAELQGGVQLLKRLLTGSADLPGSYLL